MKTCLIALGSSQGDDALAWAAADAIESEFGAACPALRIIKTDRIGPEWLNHWRDCTRVLLIDALRTGAPAGTLHVYRLLPEAEIQVDSLGHALSSHAISLRALLELATALEQQPPDLLLFGIEMTACHANQTLGQAVQSALPKLHTRICEALASPPRAITEKEADPL